MSLDVTAHSVVPDPINEAIADLSRDYEVLEQISEGGNGYVFRAVNRCLRLKRLSNSMVGRNITA